MPEKDSEIKEEIKEKKSHKIEKLEAELEKAKADVEHWKNEYYRAYADTKNLRDSLQKDHSEAMRYRAMGFVEDLLPILDSFHLALANEPKDEATKNYLVGFNFIYKNFVNALANEGVSEISPNVGDKFDPNIMDAIESVEDEGEENRILKIHGKGYKLHDRLVRPCMVTVSKKIEKTEEKDKKLDA